MLPFVYECRLPSDASLRPTKETWRGYAGEMVNTACESEIGGCFWNLTIKKVSFG